MLILSRKLNESVVIDGRITVKIVRIDKDTVKIGVDAPASVAIHREEIQQRIEKDKATKTQLTNDEISNSRLPDINGPGSYHPHRD